MAEIQVVSQEEARKHANLPFLLVVQADEFSEAWASSFTKIALRFRV